MPEPAPGRNDAAPSLDALCGQLGGLSRTERLVELRADQHRRWRRGHRVAAEEYLERLPDLCADEETAVDLICSEVLLRRELGEAPAEEEYLRRFPQYAGPLRQQFALDRALDDSSLFDTLAEVGSHTPPPPRFPLPAAPPPPGAPVLPGYRILGELGRGGMGVVYQAEQLGLRRVVALKVILAGPHAGPTELARFQAEATAAARLQHPNIVQVYEVGEHDGRHFFSLEYVAGGSLAQRLSGKPLPPAEAAALVEALARAVHHAHRFGVVHRDLKPANVLLSAGEQSPERQRGVAAPLADARGSASFAECIPKITDFGLAKQLDDAGGTTVSGAILGTPSYMAPEQAEGRGGAVGPAADTYALGAILYECLTGRPPFKGTTLLDTLEQVRTREPLPVRQLRPGVPRDLETICLKCLQKAPQQRYAAACGLADDLRRFLAGEPIQARPVGAVERSWRWCRRNPAPTALAVVGALVLFVLLPAGLWYARGLEEARANERRAREEAAAAQRAQELAEEAARTHEYFSLRNQIRERTASAPLGWTWQGLDDLTRAAALPTAARDPVELRSQAAACLAGVDLRAKAVLADDFVANVLAFSPDGKLLAAAEHGTPVFAMAYRVFLLDPAGDGLARRLTFPAGLAWYNGRLAPDGARSVAFSPDGKRLAIGTRSGYIHRWDLAEPDAGPVSWKAAEAREVEHLVFSPDGRWLWSACENEVTVKRWDAAAAGRELARFRGKVWMNGLALSPDGCRLACSCDARILFLDPESLAPCREPLAQSAGPMGFSPDGRVLATWDNGHLLLLDAETDRLVRTLPGADAEAGHEGRIDRLAFSPDGALVITTCSSEKDRKVKVWDIAGGRLVATLVAGSTGPVAAAVSPAGGALAVTGDRRVVLHELAGLREQTVVAPHAYPLQAVSYSPDGRALACAGACRGSPPDRDKKVTLWGSAGGVWRQQQLFAPLGNAETPAAVAFHPKGDALAFGGGADEVLVWDAAGRRAVRSLPAASASCLAFDRRGRALWVVVEKRSVQSWSWPEGTVAARWENDALTTGMSELYCLAVGERWLLAGGRDGAARLLRTADGKLEKRLPGPGGPVRSAALSPDEGLAVAGSQEGKVRVVRLPDGKVVADLHDHRDGVEAVVFSPDGHLFATGARDGRVHLYVCRGESFRCLLTLPAFSGPVIGLAFHPDGGTLAVVVQKETAVRLWHLDRLHDRLRQMGLDDPQWPATTHAEAGGPP